MTGSRAERRSSQSFLPPYTRLDLGELESMMESMNRRIDQFEEKLATVLRNMASAEKKDE